MGESGGALLNQEIKDRIEQIRQEIIPAGYKQYRNDIFPSDWEVKQLKDIAPLQRGFDLPASKVNIGDTPVCYSNGISRYHNEYKVEGPGVVTGRSGTIGNVFYITDNFWPHNTTLWVTDFKRNVEKFVYYLYKYIKLERFHAGTGVPTLNRNDVHMHKIPIPNKVDEQQKIADILSTWDRAIELKESLIKEKEEQKKGMVQYLLKPHEKRKWREVKVGDIFTVTRGNVLARKFISNERNSDYKYPVYSSQTKNNGLLGYYKEYLYNDAITWTTDGANAGDTNFRPGKFYCTNVCGVLISDEGYANVCVAEILNSVTKRYVSYVGNPKLMNNVMKDIKIYLPSISEQHRIAKILSTADQEIDLLKQEVEQLKEQKKGLMQLLLTGIVRVKEAVTSG